MPYLSLPLNLHPKKCEFLSVSETLGYESISSTYIRQISD